MKQLKSAVSAPATSFTELTPGATLPPSMQWRKTTVSGHYAAHDIVVRLRSVEGKPAYEILTLFTTDTGQIIIVNRGYVRPTVGTDLPNYDAAPPGKQTLTARLRQAERSTDRSENIHTTGPTQIYSIDPQYISKISNQNIWNGYLQLVENQPGSLSEIPLPQLDSGPYLSYGLQWLAFGIMAPLALGYFGYAEIKNRRADTAAIKSTNPAHNPSARTIGAAPSLTNLETKAKLAHRYGKS